MSDFFDRREMVRDFFQAQEGILRNFYSLHERGGLELHFESIATLKDVFRLEDRCFRCIDDRTPGGLHAAGPVILMDEKKGVDMLRRTRAEGIYSHTGCSAAAIAFEDLSENMKKFYENPDNYGMFYAKRMAKKADIPYMGHILALPHFNMARLAVYDGTGSFDNSKLETIGLPPAFVISRRYHSDAETAMKEVSLALTAATSSQGFGRLIKAGKTPFLILVVGARQNEFSLNRLMEEAEEVAKDFGGKVIVDGFVAPA